MPKVEVEEIEHSADWVLRVHEADIAKKVDRLVPLAVIKG